MLSGELVQWNDERGFGFIAGGDGKRYFAHISSIGRIANRPRVGDSVTFMTGIGRDGRPDARNVSIRGANPRASHEVLQRGLPAERRRLDWRLPVALLLAGLVLITSLLGKLPLAVALAYGVMSALSFGLYRMDKSFAEARQWRISEVMLLSTDFCLGIVGGLVGQALFRHKTRKPSYVTTTLLIACVHLLWLGGLASGLIHVENLQDLPATFMSMGG